MKLIKFFLYIIGIIAVGVLGFMWYSGFFTSIEINEREVGPYQLVFVEHFGDYSKTPHFQDSLYNKLLKDKIETFRGFGIYYTNPQTEPDVSKHHSLIGCILEEKDYDKIPDLTRRLYRVERMGKTNSLVVEIPFRNQFSIIAGIMRVYPKINEYVKEKAYQPKAIMEIYDIPNAKITYSMEIVKK